MSKQVTIYGKDTWHHTTAAREDFASKGYDVVYKNLITDPDFIDEMLGHSGNKRRVPVIVENGEVTIGFGGTWGI